MNKTTIKTLEEMEGQEVYYSDWGVVGIEYPFVWKAGEKIKLTQKQWEELYNGYFHSSSNEGYWLLKEAKEEFG